MSTPVVESIAEDIQDAVDAITIAAGFNQDLTAKRPIRLGLEGLAAEVDGTVVILQEEPAEDEEISSQGNPPARGWRQPFWLAAYVIASDAVTTPIDTRLNQVRSDIEKKLRADPTRGGYAIDTLIRAPIFFNEDEGCSGIVVVIEVRYRTSEDDPCVQA